MKLKYNNFDTTTQRHISGRFSIHLDVRDYETASLFADIYFVNYITVFFLCILSLKDFIEGH